MLLLSCKSIQTTINQTGTGNTATTATAEKPDAMATGADATAVEAEKPKAPVQVGTGNQNQVTDNTKAGQKGGAAATAEGAQASVSTEKGGTPWWVYSLVAGLGAAGDWVLRGKVSIWHW
ncbi:hypothetical protein DNI29_19205 [Hymenobacter sediminis]|uniref:hypothetical protein n=1 Tax=Hymenobacter sediminis TaxID=2218621 RepID=UPI000DA6D8C6|nr:hypothetical protein [Hymenobacter sediminis]RPD44838.1 hypothetical protein DNI29_19205 [Hymenobacter sediminis]